jgi:hypothetical protein
MVTRVVIEMNRSAHEKHAEELRTTLAVSQKERLETADQNVVAFSDSVVSIENIDTKDSEGPKLTEADATVSSCYCQCAH